MIRDTSLIFNYQVKHLLRTPVIIVIGVIQPLLWLVLYGPLLNKVTAQGLSEGEAFDQFAPGLLVMLALFGSLYAGFGMITEIRSGVIERLLVSRMNPWALLVGKILRDVVIVLVQAMLLLTIAVLMGLRADIGGMLLTIALFVLIVMLTAGFSYAVAMALRDENTMSQSLGFVSLPLLLLSGVILPLDLAPGWLRGIATVNPFYQVVEASRAMMAGTFDDLSIPVAFFYVALLTLLVIRWAVGSLRRI